MRKLLNILYVTTPEAYLSKDGQNVVVSVKQEEVFRIMEIEKLISYFFLTFILVVACFNLVGSLSMLMLDLRYCVAPFLLHTLHI